jgi:hypothetical protein
VSGRRGARQGSGACPTARDGDEEKRRGATHAPKRRSGPHAAAGHCISQREKSSKLYWNCIGIESAREKKRSWGASGCRASRMRRVSARRARNRGGGGRGCRGDAVGRPCFGPRHEKGATASSLRSAGMRPLRRGEVETGRVARRPPRRGEEERSHVTRTARGTEVRKKSVAPVAARCRAVDRVMTGRDLRQTKTRRWGRARCGTWRGGVEKTGAEPPDGGEEASGGRQSR